MSGQENKISQILKAFSQEPIYYHRIYSQISGSVTAGLLLSRIVYWWCKDWIDHPEQTPFYKTDNDFALDLAMGAKELRNAKSKLKKLGLITTKRRGVPARTFYTVEETALLAQISSWAERGKLDRPKRSNKAGRKGQTITDKTQSLHKEIKNSSSLDLSSKESRQLYALTLLTGRGVDEKVARSIVFNQSTPLESIEEVIKNGLVKEYHAKKTGGIFRLKAGYIVKALNQARSEGKVVGPTKISREFSEHRKRMKQARDYTPLSKEEFEQKKNRQMQALQVANG